MQVTVAIPSIPARTQSLGKAIGSAMTQSRPIAGLSVAIDLDRQGAAATRQRALDGVTTDWVAFLDDDDWFYPDHLATLATYAQLDQADYAYSYYMVHDAFGAARPDIDPLGHLGREFDHEHPHQTTITTLVRTELAQSVGFRTPPAGALIDGQTYGEDFQFTVECVKAGAKVIHVPQRTWAWSHHGRNTSGQPNW